jgi:hypothetical protein
MWKGIFFVNELERRKMSFDSRDKKKEKFCVVRREFV